VLDTLNPNPEFALLGPTVPVVPPADVPVATDVIFPNNVVEAATAANPFPLVVSVLTPTPPVVVPAIVTV